MTSLVLGSTDWTKKFSRLTSNTVTGWSPVAFLLYHFQWFFHPVLHSSYQMSLTVTLSFLTLPMFLLKTLDLNIIEYDWLNMGEHENGCEKNYPSSLLDLSKYKLSQFWKWETVWRVNWHQIWSEVSNLNPFKARSVAKRPSIWGTLKSSWVWVN